MKKVYLTKQREKALHRVLSIDDILYEKFRRLNENLQKDIKNWQRKNQVVRVIQRGKDYNNNLKILKEWKTDDGMVIEVE